MLLLSIFEDFLENLISTHSLQCSNAVSNALTLVVNVLSSGPSPAGEPVVPSPPI